MPKVHLGQDHLICLYRLVIDDDDDDDDDRRTSALIAPFVLILGRGLARGGGGRRGRAEGGSVNGGSVTFHPRDIPPYHELNYYYYYLF